MGAVDVLKHHTGALHTRLEQSHLLSRLVAPDLTRDEYCVVLERIYGYLHSAESLLSDWQDALTFELRARIKVPLLEADVRVLGTDTRQVARCAFV